ncbi:hypothetical protein KIL84_017910 [Mauremys mutica]|uniref:G-protein coupled receptors family 1 profile domain-containing protein n=1 Tax=Mauremys mutica TaxID=74926 RepID=A0A9D3XUN6_9SAUR|nr:hypothetical protein KIL84_017910 [Mauremys mutica]
MAAVPHGRARAPLHLACPPQVAKQQEQSATTQKAEREVTKMVVVMVAGFLVCWLPYASFALWVVTHRGEPFDVRLASVPSVFSKASTVYNPVIYVFMNKQVGAGPGGAWGAAEGQWGRGWGVGSGRRAVMGGRGGRDGAWGAAEGQ